VHGSEQNPSLDNLKRDVADIVIMPGTVLDEHYLEHLHWADTYMLVTAKHASGIQPTFTQLAETVRYVAWRHAGVEALHHQLHCAQVRLSHRGELSCVDTLLDLVRKGHCMSIMPRTLLPLNDGSFDCIPLPVTVARRISVIARPVSLMSNAANAVLDALRQATRPQG
jgi:DNA-binding transcriptional LysR family regulator